MCGIFGIYSEHAEILRDPRLLSIVNGLKHRGPDDGAYWLEPPFFFGHRRLSIIDIQGGSQPMARREGDLVVIFNGEIYNYLELRGELEEKGYVFATRSDTEILLHGYREWQADLPRKLTGMFAFAIADREKQEVFLARDRFGEKPLYILRQKDFLAFASELGPLLALPQFTPHLDPNHLIDYLLLNFVPQAGTLVQEIKKLLPGHWTLWQKHTEKSEAYWSLPASSVTPQDRPSSSLPHALDQAVKFCLRSDVPVGIFLSGGIDSSLIAESAMRQGSLHAAFLLDFKESNFSERSAAEAVAKRLNLRLERVVLDEDDLINFPAIAEHADDPMADSSALAVWVLARFAAKHCKVVLGGDGGDELFAGYQTYLATLLHQDVIAPLPQWLKHTLSHAARQIPVNEGKVTFTYKLQRFLRAASLASGEAHFTWNGAWMPAELSRLTTIAEGRQARDNLTRLAKAHQLLSHIDLSRLQKTDLQEILTNDFLVKIDRMSMAHSLELRAPFLNHTFAETVIHSHAHAPRIGFFKKGRLKLQLRALALEKFGPEIAYRRKQGFSIPIHQWLRGRHRQIFLDLLNKPAIEAMGVFDPDEVARCVALHDSGKKSLGYELWGLALLSAWHQQKIQRKPSYSEQPTLRRVNYLPVRSRT